MIYLTSDTHFCHDKQFLWGPRGFDSPSDMNAAIIERWNARVTPEDEVYILGDLMLTDSEGGMRCLSQLNGTLHIILGNHDTDSRVEMYKTLPNVVEMVYATMLKHKYNGKTLRFYLSHYPTLTANIDKEYLAKAVINLHGHTHSKSKFGENPFMYNVAMDAHDCTPVSIDEVCGDMVEHLQRKKAVL